MIRKTRKCAQTDQKTQIEWEFESHRQSESENLNDLVELLNKIEKTTTTKNDIWEKKEEED